MPIIGPRHTITLDDDRYPPLLRESPDPPPELSVVGDPAVLASHVAVALTGARRCSPYGLRCAHEAGELIATAGLPLVTGGAVGVQAGAIEGALAYHKRCIVVLGSGIDQPYPECHAGLFQRVVDCGGAIVSPWPDHMPPRPCHFRWRNEVITRMSCCLVLIEAGAPSGSFSMADETLKLDRAVLAFPGQIYASASAGCNSLIADGDAVCIDSIQRLADWLSIIRSDYAIND